MDLAILRRCSRYWHLLSLDAPTVAAVWAWFFARVHHLTLPAATLLLLAMATWIVYVADRILDGMAPAGRTHLRERHRFYQRHRPAFLRALALVTLALLGLSGSLLSRAALRDYLCLGALALLYMSLVHGGRRRLVALLPKELVVGAIFAAAAAVPAVTRQPRHPGAVVLAALWFAALCWLNCIAIEAWESRADCALFAQAHPTTRFLGAHLRAAALLLAAGAAAVAALAASRALAHVGLAIAGSALMLAALDAARARFAALDLRIAADAALLTPLAPLLLAL